MGLFSSVKKAVSSVAKVALPAAAGYFMGGGSGNFLSTVGPALINGGLSYMGQSSANAFNAEEAEKNRQWQEQMRATQYQTAVKDMQAAGLNPMLAYQNGGAGNLSGAVSASAQNALGQFVSSALQTRQLEGQLEQIEHQNRNLEEQNKQIQAGTQESKDRAWLARQQAQTEVARSYRESAEGIRTEQSTQLDRLESAARIGLMAAQTRNYDANSAYTATRNYQDSLNTPALEADKRARGTMFGDWARRRGTNVRDLGAIFQLFGR